ncbi:MAG: alkaline phosphatase D family protein [Bacteroidota bacterium]
MKSILVALILTTCGASVVKAQYYTKKSFAGGSTQSVFLDEGLAPFYHGVASGDPLADRVILWTRVTPQQEAPVKVHWVVATDTALKNIVVQGDVLTDASRDYTVKIDAVGLQPASYYYYGFTALGAHSLVGRTKTLPVGHVERVKVAQVSCSNFSSGFFNVYARIAERNDIDVVVHLGDYIYEGDGNSLRQVEPASEITVLADYRARYAQYHTDPDLMRLNQCHPWITVWDDHETANDAYETGAENHTEGAEGSWIDREAQAVQAYHEWLPIRDKAGEDQRKIYRSFQFGDLLKLVMLETRLIARSKQQETQFDQGFADTSRHIVGTEQLNWIKSQLSDNQNTWRMLGNQVPVAQLQAGPVSLFGFDKWEGYPAEKKSLITYLKDNVIPNVVVITGDVHSSYAFDLPENPYSILDYNPFTGAGSLGVEFVGTSVTSKADPANDFEKYGMDVLGALQKLGNGHLKFIQENYSGYNILVVTPEKTQCDFYHINSRMTQNTQQTLDESWMVAVGTNRLSKATSSIPDYPVSAAPAPTTRPGGATGITRMPASAEAIRLYPNPANASATLDFVLEKPGKLSLHLYDRNGRLIQSPVTEVAFTEGRHKQQLDLRELAEGHYFCEVRAGGVSTIVKMMVVKGE